MMYDVVFSGVCFCDLFGFVYFCFLYMCRVVFDSLRFVMTFRLFVIVYLVLYVSMFLQQIISGQINNKTIDFFECYQGQAKSHKLNETIHGFLCVPSETHEHGIQRLVELLICLCFSDDQETQDPVKICGNKMCC